MRSNDNKQDRNQLATAVFAMTVLIASVGIGSQYGLMSPHIALATDKILYDDFGGSSYTLADGQTSPNGKWIDVYNGYGSAGVKFDSASGSNVFFEKPETASKPNRGYGTKVVSTATFGDFELSLDMKTNKQLRVHQSPKPYETAWVMFRHADGSNYYYFMLKTNGYELGEKVNDSFYSLVTGGSPTVTLGSWQHVDITAIDNRITIAVDGNKLIDYTDSQMQSDMKNGSVGLYASNSDVNFDNVYITPMSSNTTTQPTTSPTNSTTGSGTVDVIPPSIVAPQDMTVEAAGAITVVQSLGTPSVSDNIDPTPTVRNNAPTAGFPLGTTVVTWTATDDAGNTAGDTQTVTVVDTVAPAVSITSPASGAYVTSNTPLVVGTASANQGTGISSVSVKLDLGTSIVATPKAPGDWSTWSASISISTSGSHSITAVATDLAGNTGSQSITITKGTTTASSTGLTLYDDFDGTSYCLTSDGVKSPDGKWKTGYVAYGSACIKTDTADSSNQVFVTTPKLDSTLRAARIDSTQSWNNIHAKMTVRLDKQNTYNTQSWYTVWPLIGYVDETNHYYFNLKTNGWELGKKDNDLDPSLELQRYLALGGSPKITLGQKVDIEYWIILGKSPANGVTSNHIIVNVNGAKVVDIWDDGTHSDGMGKINATGTKLQGPKRISLYNEASMVSWDSIYVEEAQ